MFLFILVPVIFCIILAFICPIFFTYLVKKLAIKFVFITIIKLLGFSYVVSRPLPKNSLFMTTRPGESTNSNSSSEGEDEFDNLPSDRYPRIVGSSTRSVKDNEEISKLNLKKLKQEAKSLYNENFNLMTERERVLELSEDPNLSKEDRDRHKENSEALWDKGQEIKEQHETKCNLIKSLERQLERNPDYEPSEGESSSVGESSSESSSNMDDVDV